MPALPWTSIATAESDKEYPALLSRLPLKTFGAMPKFIRFVFGIRSQLADSEGLIGYSLDAHPLAKEFWTLSVWEDRDSLWRFVQRMPHSRAMSEMLPHMGQTEFFHFEVTGDSVPRIGKRPSGAYWKSEGRKLRLGILEQGSWRWPEPTSSRMARCRHLRSWTPRSPWRTWPVRSMPSMTPAPMRDVR